MANDIWHLSLEDLLAPTIEPAHSTGPGPFVITLKTASAVIGMPPQGLLDFDTLRMYQLVRTEAGRPQYLLRLGIIDSELEADAILAAVREHYPRASKDAAGADDKAEAGRAMPAAAPRKPMRSRPAAAQATPPLRWDIDDILPELGDLRPADSEPKELDPDAVTDEVEALSSKTESAAQPCAADVAERRRVDAAAIDSTQTVRALTPIEIGADVASRCFSIQLYLGEQQVNAEQVPNLDIFEEYRLYSIAGLDGERIVHALRLGFFSSERAAEAVAGYLAAFFDGPTIQRVSIAERERFAEVRVAASKDVGAAGTHAVIELAGAAPLPGRRSEAASSGGGARRAVEATSLWSRLLAPRAHKR